MSAVTLASWNINRGLQFDGIANTLAALNADVVLLQEADLNARRSGRRDVVRDLARRLAMKHVFGAEFRELSQESPGSFAYQGQALLTCWPIRSVRVLRFQAQTGYWSPRWYVPNLAFFQRRLGGRMALIAEVDVGGRRLVLYNVHLESRGNETLRLRQLEEILADIRRYPPDAGIVLAGDFNNRTLDSPIVSRLIEAGFRDALRHDAAHTTPRGRIIDWIFVSGPWSVAYGKVLGGVTASDHYPVVTRISAQDTSHIIAQ